MSKTTGKEKKWVITFSNGYCGCDQEDEFEGTYEERLTLPKNGLTAMLKIMLM